MKMKKNGKMTEILIANREVDKIHSEITISTE